MKGVKALILLQLACLCSCMDQLHIMYEWKQIDFEFPTPEARQQAIENRTFIPENNIPMGLEIYEDRLFITVPRWKAGVPSSLNYINLKDNTTTSPKLIPYPNWEAHSLDADGKPHEVISPFRIRADRCGRLWILDNGKVGHMEQHPVKYPSSFKIYDMKTDKLLRTHIFPEDQSLNTSFFANIAVEALDCDDTYAYAGDIHNAVIVVYSWKRNESWKISHDYLKIDPLATNFSVLGYNFTWKDAVFGMGLTSPKADNFSTLYFHPMSGFDEFSVSTEYLRNQSLAEANPDAFKHVGNRGPNSQSSAAFVDQKTGVLFYSLVNLNAVACWKTSNKEYSMKNQGRIYMNDDTMVFPSDIKVDFNDNLWILSNKFFIWRYDTLDLNEFNFRVFSAPVVDAISHTACDITPRTDILDKYVKNAKSLNNSVDDKTNGNSGAAILCSSLFAMLIMFFSSFVSFV